MREKSEAIYRAGLAIAFLWDLAQAYMVRGNAVLLACSLLVLLITVFGAWLTLTEEGRLQRIWMLFYLVPAGLMAVGAARGFHEFRDTLLVGAGEVPPASLIPGSSADYGQALASHYLSMLAAPAAWVLAHLLPLLARPLRRSGG